MYGVVISMATKAGIIWSEIDHRFIKDAQGRLKIAENVAAVMSSIDNILRTRRGERVMLPSFGSDLAGVLFEPVNSSTIKFLSRALKNDIERWDDRVLISSVEIYPDPDSGYISITLLFSIKGISDLLKYETVIKGEA